MLLSDYDKLLHDDRWRSKRAEILRRDDFTCQHCWSNGCKLQVHHITRGPKGYEEPWACSDDCLVSLCLPCHEKETFYGNDAQRYLWKIIIQKRICPGNIRSLTTAVNAICKIPNGGSFKLESSSKEREIEEFNVKHIIPAVIELINTIGKRFCSHPFMNNLVASMERIPDKMLRSPVEFWFEY